jgi:hypothetical protein
MAANNYYDKSYYAFNNTTSSVDFNNPHFNAPYHTYAHTAAEFNKTDCNDRKYVRSNEAKLDYVATFKFEYEDNSEPKSVRVLAGDRVTIEFNAGKHGNTYIVRVTGVATTISPLGDNGEFILTLDASKRNMSKVYRIGSRAVLDVDILEDDEEEPEEEEVVEDNKEDDIYNESPIVHIKTPFGKPNIIDNSQIPPKRPEIVDHKPYNPRPFGHPVVPAGYITMPKDAITLVPDEERGYHVLMVRYTKKRPGPIMLCVSDSAGNLLYRAIDNKVMGGQSVFLWTLRDYITEIDKLSTVRKLRRYTLDSESKFVYVENEESYYSKDETIQAIETSNETVIKYLNFTVQLVYALDNPADLLSYSPKTSLKSATRLKYAVESRRVTLSQEDLEKTCVKQEVEVDESNGEPDTIGSNDNSIGDVVSGGNTEEGVGDSLHNNNGINDNDGNDIEEDKKNDSNIDTGNSDSSSEANKDDSLEESKDGGYSKDSDANTSGSNVDNTGAEETGKDSVSDIRDTVSSGTSSVDGNGNPNVDTDGDEDW